VFWPFRVVASLGFALASLVHVPHLAATFLAAILSAASWRVFALSRVDERLRAHAPARARAVVVPRQAALRDP